MKKIILRFLDDFVKIMRNHAFKLSPSPFSDIDSFETSAAPKNLFPHIFETGREKNLFKFFAAVECPFPYSFQSFVESHVIQGKTIFKSSFPDAQKRPRHS